MISGGRGRCVMAVAGGEKGGWGEQPEQWEVEDSGSRSVGGWVGGVRKEGWWCWCRGGEAARTVTLAGRSGGGRGCRGGGFPAWERRDEGRSWEGGRDGRGRVVWGGVGVDERAQKKERCTLTDKPERSEQHMAAGRNEAKEDMVSLSLSPFI